MTRKADREREQLLKLAAEHFAALGGRARAEQLTPAERSRIARRAAAARWGKKARKTKKGK